MTKDEFAPVTPGEMLKEEFLAEYGLSQNMLATAIGTSPNRIAEIVNDRRRITADTALRLSLYFGNSPEFWMNLQTCYDLKMARQNLRPEGRQAHQSASGRVSGRPPPHGRRMSGASSSRLGTADTGDSKQRYQRRCAAFDWLSLRPAPPSSPDWSPARSGERHRLRQACP